MQALPYLTFNGNCAEAFRYYAQVLGGTIELMMTHGESPMAEETPPEWKSMIMHTRLRVGDMVLLASDAPGDYFKQPQGFSVSLMIDTPAQAEQVFTALAAGGTVTMPFGETFWALKFGSCIDRFGTPWMVNCMRPM